MARPGGLVWLRRMSWPVVASVAVLVVFSLSALFAPFVAPYDYAEQNRAFPNCPPSPLRLNQPSLWVSDGMLYARRYVLQAAAGRTYETTAERVPLSWFTRGSLLTTVQPEERLFLLGTDAL